MTVAVTAAEWAGARGQQWCDYVTQLEAMMAGIDEPLIEALQLDRPLRIADLACGGGATTAHLLRRAPAGSVVHGFDISPALVAHAGQRVATPIHCADLASDGPPGAPYDRLASRFGMMFFDDPPAAFRNLTRWLVPGGRFAFVVWAHPRTNRWMGLVREVVAELVELPTPEPDAPGPFRYGDVEPLRALLTQAGFSDVAAHPWQGEMPVGGGLTADEAATFGTTAFGTFAERLAEAGEAVRHEAHTRLAARLRPHERDGRVYLPAAVHVVTGTRR